MSKTYLEKIMIKKSYFITLSILGMSILFSSNILLAREEQDNFSGISQNSLGPLANSFPLYDFFSSSVTTIERVELIKTKLSDGRTYNYILKIEGDGRVEGTLINPFPSNQNGDYIISIENAQLSEELSKPNRLSLFFREVGISRVSVEEDESTNSIVIRLRPKTPLTRIENTSETAINRSPTLRRYADSINFQQDFYLLVWNN